MAWREKAGKPAGHRWAKLPGGQYVADAGRRCRWGKGWSLKETLIAMAIITLVAAIAFPIFVSMRYRVYENRCRANLWAILTHFEQLRAQGMRPKELSKELKKWMETEGRAVSRCPWTVRKYLLRYGQNQIFVYGNEVVEVPPEQADDNRDVIVWCTDHTSPPSDPSKDLKGVYKFLCALLRGGKTPSVDYVDPFRKETNNSD